MFLLVAVPNNYHVRAKSVIDNESIRRSRDLVRFPSTTEEAWTIKPDKRRDANLSGKGSEEVFLQSTILPSPVAIIYDEGQSVKKQAQV